MNALARTWLRRIALGLPIVTAPAGVIGLVAGTGCSCPPDRTAVFPVDERQAALVISDDGRSVDLAGCQQVCGEVTTTLPDGGMADAGFVGFRPSASGCQLLSEDEMLYVECAFPVDCVGGRKPAGLRAPVGRAADAGEWLARMAWMEAASVPAFQELARDLARLGAPDVLVRGAARAAHDERRHARAIARLARARGASVPRVVRAASRAPGLRELALDNAVEGGVRETFGALLAAVQAERAGDRDVREAMRAIARDEARHAILSDAIDRWAGSAVDRAEIERARGAAVAELRAAIDVDALPEEASAALGLPDAATQRVLLDALA